MTTMKKIIFTLVASLALSTSFAKRLPDQPAEQEPTAPGVIKIATGPNGKGYSKLFKDIKSVCGNVVSLQEVNTDGGLGNLSALSTNKAKLGFAQLDTFMTMKNGDENIANLLQVIPLNHNYLHIVVSTTGVRVAGAKKWGGLSSEPDQFVRITSASQLRGKRVALVGSAQLLGRKLDKQLGYNMSFIDVATDDDAFAKVRSGEANAAFTVSGWPSGPVDKLDMKSGLTLASFDVPSVAPFVVKSVTYRGIGVYNVQVLASRNVLFTRPFKGASAKDVAKLKTCITNNLQDLKEGEYEPGWNEVKNVDQNLGVDTFK